MGANLGLAYHAVNVRQVNTKVVHAHAQVIEFARRVQGSMMLAIAVGAVRAPIQELLRFATHHVLTGSTYLGSAPTAVAQNAIRATLARPEVTYPAARGPTMALASRARIVQHLACTTADAKGQAREVALSALAITQLGSTTSVAMGPPVVLALHAAHVARVSMTAHRVVGPAMPLAQHAQSTRLVVIASLAVREQIQEVPQRA